MSDLPIPALLGALFVLLILSGFFSGSETAMMAANRYRLRHKANEGHRGARLALALLEQTDRLMGLILLGNTLLNAAAATLTGYIAVALFKDSEWALEIGTLCITFALLVVAEISPKVVCANYADKIAPVISYGLTPLLRLASPVVWFVNLFVAGLLRILHLTPKAGLHSSQTLSPEELRTLVLESANFIPQKHRTILSNLFELNEVTVEDVMTPRGAIEMLDLAQPWEEVREQLTTSHHSRLPVCQDSLDHLLGVLPLRRLLGVIEHETFSVSTLHEHLAEPYYIPSGTPAFAQLAFFQENRQRIGFVVDEYGEILGLLTVEDIMEEIVGQFTTSLPDQSGAMHWNDEGWIVIDGGRSLREINRQLDLNLPTDGPKTLNGLILEHFEDIPEAGVSLRFGNITVEVIQTRDRSVRTAKLFRPE